MPDQARRKVLKVLSCASAGAAGAPLMAACSGGAGEGQGLASGPVPAGNISGFDVGDVRVLDQAVVALRDAGGIYAMSTICTHNQCDMRLDGSITANRLDCDCHGSAFDANGNTLSGPARGALIHYLVEVADDGELTVQADEIVATTERLVVMGG